VIAVEAVDEYSAKAAVETFLEGYGDGRVWDWYEVGGRWDNSLPNGRNYLRYSDDAAAFKKAVQQCLLSRNAEFRELRDLVTGKEVGPEDVADYVYGLPVGDDKENAARQQTKRNQEYSEQLKQLLEEDSLPEEFDSHMVGYQLQKLGQLIAGSYIFESYFADGAEYSTGTDGLWKRCEADASLQWLVVVDLHN
jgi:hypothetical protein